MRFVNIRTIIFLILVLCDNFYDPNTNGQN